MSYDSMVDHLRNELATGATRRRRAERCTRRVALAAVIVLAVATAGGLVALRSHEDELRIATTPGDARLEVCHAFLDYQSSLDLFNPAVSQSLLADLDRVAAASGDAELARIAHTIARTNLATGEGAGPDYYGALNDMHDRCKALGDPDFSPTIVAAPLPPKPNVDLAAYGASRLFGPPVDVPAIVRDGRDLSPVQVASAEGGAHVAMWSARRFDGARTYCIMTKAGRNGSGGCGTDAAPTLNNGARALQVTSSGGTGNPVSLQLATTSGVSFAVLQFEKASFVQQPVFGRLIFVWDEGPQSPRTDYVVRAYDANGVQLDCLAFGVRSC